MSFQLEQKCDESSKSSTVARNEYLLYLGTANSHQKRYYEVDLPEAMRVCIRINQFLALYLLDVRHSYNYRSHFNNQKKRLSLMLG